MQMAPLIAPTQFADDKHIPHSKFLTNQGRFVRSDEALSHPKPSTLFRMLNPFPENDLGRANSKGTDNTFLERRQHEPSTLNGQVTRIQTLSYVTHDTHTNNPHTCV